MTLGGAAVAPRPDRKMALQNEPLAGRRESRLARIDPYRYRTLLFYVSVTVSAFACLVFVAPFLRILCWAVVLHVIVRPVHARVIKRVRNGSLAAGLCCLFVATCILLPTGLVAIRASHEVGAIAADLRARSQANGGSTTSAGDRRGALNGTGAWLRRQADALKVDLDSALRDATSQVSSALARQTFAAVRVIVWGVVQAALVLMTLFFLLRDGGRIEALVRPFLPLEEEEAGRLIGRVGETIHAIVFGNIIVALAQGSLAGGAYWALGIPAPLLWTVATTVLCLIPLLGAPIVWIPAACLLAWNGEYGRAAAMVVWGMVVVGTIDNVLRPIVIGSRVQLHPLPLFFCIFGAVLTLGPVGLVLGPVALAVTVTLLDIFRSRLQPLHPQTSAAVRDGPPKPS